MLYYLMIKEAVGHDYRYLCKCAEYVNPYKYKGSGVLWRRFIDKHDPHISTEIIGLFDKDQLKHQGMMLSEKYNIVEDPRWANCIPEIGDGGSTVKGKIRAFQTSNPKNQRFFDSIDDLPAGWIRGIPPRRRTAEEIDRIKSFHKGRKRSDDTRMKMRESVRRPRLTVQCECGRQITRQNIVRHQMKCKGQ